MPVPDQQLRQLLGRMTDTELDDVLLSHNIPPAHIAPPMAPTDQRAKSIAS